MKLELTQKLQQQQILGPQMILSMDILLLNAADLQQRVEQEFMENPALEISEKFGETKGSVDAPPADQPFEKVGQFEAADLGAGSLRSRAAGKKASDTKLETLQNTEGRPPGLKDYLMSQVRLAGLTRTTSELAEQLVNNLDHRGYLVAPAQELYESLGDSCDRLNFDEALDVVRHLDPPGVGAENLQECLLLQLDRDPQDYPLESEIILHHLQDLGQNRLPKIAKEIGANLEELKDALEIIQSLDPLPGARYESAPTIYVRPDVFVEEVDDELTVRIEDYHLPQLTVNTSCRQLTKSSTRNSEVNTFLRKKIDSAQWLIQAIEQRQRTLLDIAVAMVNHQRDFMLLGPENLKALKMQTLADKVGVHISTISRAIKGKYVQTPYGLYELRYFFTGGVGNADGEVESRRNVYRMIAELVEKEDKGRPYSDPALARLLQGQGLSIARRTVTKYREAQGIPSSRLRKEY